MVQRWITKWARAAACAGAMFFAGVLAFAAPAHPHLFFDSSEIPALKARINDPFYADSWNEVKIDVRSSFRTAPEGQPSRRHATGLRAHAAFLLLDPETATTNDRYNSDEMFPAFFNSILNASGWSDFFGNGTLDSAYYLIALATAYDWHYDKFTPSQRTDIINKLANRCDYIIDQTTNVEIPNDLYRPGSEYIHQFKVLRNKFVVQFSALGFVALALEGEVNESRRMRWLNTANNCLNVWADIYSDDAVTHESYSYRILEMQCLIQFLEAKSRKTGENEFLKYPELRNHPLYSLFCWVPGGDRSFASGLPLGDGGSNPAGEIRVIDALLARRLAPLNNGVAGLSNWMQDGTTTEHNNSYYRTEALQFFFADKNVPVTSPQSVNLPTWHFFPQRELFVWRSGWGDDAMYFSTNGGRQMGGHMLPEKGNFVIYKAGAPYVAHHYYMGARRTMDFNMMTVDGAGQYGEDMSRGSTDPQLPTRRAYVTSLIADTQMFNIVLDLKPIYSSSKLQNYTREFVGWDNMILVRDVARTSSNVDFKYYNQAYRTINPVDHNDTLDPDSDPTANPWGGSGRSRTITPRTAGPFTGTMAVRDLSRASWSSTVTDARPSLEAGDNIRRGSKLERTLNGRDAGSLMGYAFLGSGESLEAMPSEVAAEGFRLLGPGGVSAICAWPTGASVDSALGLKVVGTMGGLHLDKQWAWGRGLRELEYWGLRYLTASTPVNAFVSYTDHNVTVKVQANAAGWIEVYAPFDVEGVLLNDQPISNSSWSYAYEKLRINVSGNAETVTLRSMPRASDSAANAAWLSTE